jgi:hypothetical protein
MSRVEVTFKKDQPSAGTFVIVFNPGQELSPGFLQNGKLLQPRLLSFMSEGMMLKVNPLHEVARYDGDTEAHAHLICQGYDQIVKLGWEPSDYSQPLPKDLHVYRIEFPFSAIWGSPPGVNS